jgi:hypothetical protein
MKRLLVVLAVAAALWTAACSSGSGGNIIPPPPPAGTFALSSLSGTYAFVTNGEAFTNGAATATPLARTGSFIADGKGNILGGVEDVAQPGALPSLAIPFTGGSYTISADGRGRLTLNLNSGGNATSITFGITLTSTGGGLLIDETSTSAQASTGSGNFIQQNVAFCSNPLTPIAGPYVFDFTGLDGNFNPASLIGEYAVNGILITTGFTDVNDNFALSSGAITGSFGLDATNPASPTLCGRGLAQIAGEQYVYYVVDSNRIRLISAGTDGAMLTGDSVAQSNNIPTTVSAMNGGFAFIAAGASSAGGGITRIGRFTAAGTSTLSNVLQDTNNSGKFFQTNTTTSTNITLDPANPGRGIFTFTDPAFPSAPSKFIFYLSSATQGVIQEVTTSGGALVAVDDGSLSAQSGSPYTSTNVTGPYALNWSGLSFQNNGQFIDEEDLVGQVAITNLSLKGASDIFQFTNGVPVTNLLTTGLVVIVGDGTGGDGSGANGKRNTMGISLNGNSQIQFVVYFVNPKLAFFTNNSNSSTTRIVAGVLQAQQEP